MGKSTISTGPFSIAMLVHQPGTIYAFQNDNWFFSREMFPECFIQHLESLSLIDWIRTGQHAEKWQPSDTMCNFSGPNIFLTFWHIPTYYLFSILFADLGHKLHFGWLTWSYWWVQPLFSYNPHKSGYKPSKWYISYCISQWFGGYIHMYIYIHTYGGYSYSYIYILWYIYIMIYSIYMIYIYTVYCIHMSQETHIPLSPPGSFLPWRMAATPPAPTTTATSEPGLVAGAEVGMASRGCPRVNIEKGGILWDFIVI